MAQCRSLQALQKVERGGVITTAPLLQTNKPKKHSVEKTPLLHAHATRGAEGGEYRRDDRSQNLQCPFQCFLLAHKLTSFQFF